MDDEPSSELRGPTTKYEQIAERLAVDGWSVYLDFLAGATLEALIEESREHWWEGDMRAAGVGRGSSLQLRPEIRGDHVLWLDETTASPAQTAYLGELEELRQSLNERLFLGLFSYEGHLAVYPPGASYHRHLDQYQGTNHRIASVILYLNQDWRVDDGGALRLYLDDEGETFRDIPPNAGTLVTFLSDTFYHEVLLAHRQRLSVTGWFRLRP